jgi:hypothetical protein
MLSLNSAVHAYTIVARWSWNSIRISEGKVKGKGHPITCKEFLEQLTGHYLTITEIKTQYNPVITISIYTTPRL